ncbi:hypothetical protein [Aquamicrobium sp. LC103]|uniref:hypothetical protein n=1 Tax=Aquamicrobium sp. LC103 TaxID=1120658 RepID=UPI000AB3D4D3|nr:hypothetical protein [Aquamicrobium sp. LC103]TKT76333.1 hypothetical protein XW59_017345 [Aquamicrobium sp. LC103]
MSRSSFDRPLRYERLRFLLAGAIAAGFAWFCWRGFEYLAGLLGIVTRIHRAPPVEQWVQIGESWQSVWVSEDFTYAGFMLVVLSLVLAYYVARIAYRRDIRAVLDRRALWLIAGWFVGTAVLLAELRLIALLHREMPILARWHLVSNLADFVALAGSANIFASFWGLLMRRRKVPPSGL